MSVLLYKDGDSEDFEDGDVNSFEPDAFRAYIGRGWRLTKDKIKETEDALQEEEVTEEKPETEKETVETEDVKILTETTDETGSNNEECPNREDELKAKGVNKLTNKEVRELARLLKINGHASARIDTLKKVIENAA